MSTKFWGQTISRLADFDKHEPQFVIANDTTISYMGADYGPPDPPPTMESTTYVSLVALKSEAEVLEWIELNGNSKFGKSPFKVFKILPVSVHTETKITLG